jgi:hypothetical protein
MFRRKAGKYLYDLRKERFPKLGQGWGQAPIIRGKD